VAEHKRENRRQDEKENEDAAVAIDVEEFLVSDAEDGAKRLAVHDYLGLSNAS
jgi:hypothetical protein